MCVCGGSGTIDVPLRATDLSTTGRPLCRQPSPQSPSGTLSENNQDTKYKTMSSFMSEGGDSTPSPSTVLLFCFNLRPSVWDRQPSVVPWQASGAPSFRRVLTQTLRGSENPRQTIQKNCCLMFPFWILFLSIICLVFVQKSLLIMCKNVFLFLYYHGIQLLFIHGEQILLSEYT